ncbi:unnamed protein product [Candida verbasci]|uniref:Phosphatidic acid phosphatase type 2/haloperoxidase domain-containing protein n=1 Tax=Candida verbasci TaxID=1227364 RepID=A0A9W4TXF7_9ASCO|nr:unnamed protein product [Candida verbasci]
MLNNSYNPIPFDHTYILYDPNDIFSIISVQFSLLPIYIMVFYTSWFLITHEIEPVIVVGGHLINEIINKLIKHMIKHPRPDFHKGFGAGSYSLTYGMPSAHSQFMGFFITYYICVIIFKIPLKKWQKWLGCSILSFCMFGVGFSRIYLLYHSFPQVYVGFLIGITFGITFFIISSIARDLGIIDWILNWPIVRFFYIKDTYYHNYQSYKDEFNHYLELKKKKKKSLSKKYL